MVWFTTHICVLVLLWDMKHKFEVYKKRSLCVIYYQIHLTILVPV